jgi:hypothetical protein
MSLQIDSAAGPHPVQGAAHLDQWLGGRALAGRVLLGLENTDAGRVASRWAWTMLDGVRNLVLEVAATPESEPKEQSIAAGEVASACAVVASRQSER